MDEAISTFRQTILVLQQTPDISDGNREDMIKEMNNAIDQCAASNIKSNTEEKLLAEDINLCHQGGIFNLFK